MKILKWNLRQINTVLGMTSMKNFWCGISAEPILVINKRFTTSICVPNKKGKCDVFETAAFDLRKADKEQIQTFFSRFDTVITDCDGVLWWFDKAIEGSPEVINHFRKIGKKIYFASNVSLLSRSDIVAKSRRLGIIANKEEILIPAYLIAHYLNEMDFSKKAYIVGGAGLGEELEAVGVKHIGAGIDKDTKEISPKDLDPDVGAVVCGFDYNFQFTKLMKAASYLSSKKCLFLAVNDEPSYPMKDRTMVLPGAGAILKTIEVVADRKAKIFGKPHPYIRNFIQSSGLHPNRTLMIGDSCRSDVSFGNTCGFLTLLVLSGVTTRKKLDKMKVINKYPVPDAVLPKLGDMLPFIT